MSDASTSFHKTTLWCLAAGTALLCALLVVLLPAVPQDPGYHSFHATASCCGLSHAELVLTNLPFLWVGIAALFALLSPSRSSLTRAEALPWIVATLGIVATGLGSAWYHASPCTERLFWDRLPMTVAFAGLLAAAIAERLGPRCGTYALVALLLIDPATVFWWKHTEALGVGNLVPYALAQFLPLILMPVLMALTPRRTTGLLAWIGAVVLYALAKLLEQADGSLGHTLVLSGHGWKHVLAALSCAALLQHALRRRVLPQLPDCRAITPNRILKADIFGSIAFADGADGPVVLRDVRNARWWARPLAAALLLREETALVALAGKPTGLVPQIRARDNGRLARSRLEGNPLQAASPPSVLAFREARNLLRSMRQRGITHNDTHKPPNWIVLPDGRLALIDLQLASVHHRLGAWFRLQAREDLRHLLKQQERYRPGSVSPRGRWLLARKAWSTRLWMSTVKPAYIFITRRVLRWRDDEGRG
ncbi:MAG: hypothetical protein EXS14_05710 [Planctomycetes bacterium]|nr:hypothetical protein [Planctomycetota bacterium]